MQHDEYCLFIDKILPQCYIVHGYLIFNVGHLMRSFRDKSSETVGYDKMSMKFFYIQKYTISNLFSLSNFK